MSESLNCNFYKYTGDPRVANKSFDSTNIVYTCSSIKPLEALNDLDIKLIIDYPYFIDEQGKTIDRKTNLEVNGVNVYPSGLPNAGQVIPTKPFLMDANYVAFDKMWYKITSKERLTANSLAIYATIDGLKSYWTEVKECEGTCARSESVYNSQFVDPKYMLIQNREIETINIGDFSTFGDIKIIMCYNGVLPKTSGGSHIIDGHSFGGGGGNW